jgi:hypothetical protein
MHNRSFFSGLWSAIFQGPPGIDGLHTGTEHFSATSPPAGPLLNVDGTPMLNDAVDVMGKVYGDSGSAFSVGSGIHGSDW